MSPVRGLFELEADGVDDFASEFDLVSRFALERGERLLLKKGAIEHGDYYFHLHGVIPPLPRGVIVARLPVALATLPHGWGFLLWRSPRELRSHSSTQAVTKLCHRCR